MELLDETTPEQEARAARLESTRLRHVNGNPLTPRAFAADLKMRRAAPRGVDSFLGAGDLAFLSRSSIDGCLPAAQTSGGLLPLQRAIELGDVHSLDQALKTGDGNSLTRACNASERRYCILQYSISSLELCNCCYLLLSAASPLNDVPKRWRPGSLLLWAITSAQPEVVEFLVLQSRLEADCFDEDGNNSVAIAALVLATPETPERLATLKTILKLLLRREPEDGGADVNHKNMYGLTAVDVAETPASKKILAQLGATTARVVPVERVLRWDRDRFRDEIEYLPLLDVVALYFESKQTSKTSSKAQFFADRTIVWERISPLLLLLLGLVSCKFSQSIGLLLRTKSSKLLTTSMFSAKRANIIGVNP
ncbi:Ankyrin repeat-containing domain [Phytophthora cactorum]|nr:Ankyrin repeat-containing domain [Phytophthora cactorum]